MRNGQTVISKDPLFTGVQDTEAPGPYLSFKYISDLKVWSNLGMTSCIKPSRIEFLLTYKKWTSYHNSYLKLDFEESCNLMGWDQFGQGSKPKTQNSNLRSEVNYPNISPLTLLSGKLNDKIKELNALFQGCLCPNMSKSEFSSNACPRIRTKVILCIFFLGSKGLTLISGLEMFSITGWVVAVEMIR